MSKEILEKVKHWSQVLEDIPEIRYLGDPILRTNTEEVTVEEGRKIGEQLGEILIKYRKIAGVGRGLAAPQISISKSVFVTYLDDKLNIYINPRITKISTEKNYYRELCLSSGIMWADVERSETITMEWMDRDGVSHSEKISGFMARLFQHEEAHLRGRPNLDDAMPGTIEISGDPFKEQLRKSP